MFLGPLGKSRSEEIFDRLAASYRQGEWVVLPQLRDGTGWQGWRTADAIAMNCWPSRGLEVHGFEIKVSRADWQRELKNPQKAESIFAYCDRFWLVVPADAEIVRAGELPTTWGLMRVGDVVELTVEAPKLTPTPLDRAFLASILRGLHKHEAPAGRLEAAREEGRKAGVEEGRRYAERAYEMAGEAYRVTARREDLLYLERSAESLLKRIREELKPLKEWQPGSLSVGGVHEE